MKIIMGLCMLFTLVSCAQNSPSKITRYTINPWETDIGYAQVVQAGDTYHISGIACEGPSYEKAVVECYNEMKAILVKLNLSTKNIVKENVYALDIEKFKEQIDLRKKFYENADYPAATWVQIEKLYLPSHLVEIEFVAVK